jgi:hypothetical protein
MQAFFAGRNEPNQNAVPFWNARNGFLFFLGGQERTKEAHKRRKIQHRRLIRRD